MQPGNNPIETYKAALGGHPLRIREHVPRIIAETAGLAADDWDKLAPSDKEMLKWLGVFFRKPTPGKFMMRIRMPNGFATSAQLAAIADLSKKLGDNTVDVTTRQQLELRGFTLQGLPEIWERLRGLDLRSLQTGQDNVRNLNGCALAGLTPHELLDASSIVFELDRIIVGKEGNPEYANLPRKFNVVVTGCRENCTHAETQDVALIPASKDGRLGFHVLAGGKMGSGGFTIAKNLDWFVPPERAVETVLAIVQLFRDEGPRDARTKVRLAFLIADWGLESFKEKVRARLNWEPEPRGEDARSKRHNDHLGVQEQRASDLCSVGLVIPVGRTRPAGLRELARLADEYGNGAVRHHRECSARTRRKTLGGTALERMARRALAFSTRLSKLRRHRILQSGADRHQESLDGSVARAGPNARRTNRSGRRPNHSLVGMSGWMRQPRRGGYRLARHQSQREWRKQRRRGDLRGRPERPTIARRHSNHGPGALRRSVAGRFGHRDSSSGLVQKSAARSRSEVARADGTGRAIFSQRRELYGMKMIRAMIRPENEELVTQALDEANIAGFTKWDVLGRGKQKGIQVGAAVYPEIPKLSLLLVVEDEQVPKVVQAIQKGARTGHPGDGRIFVSDVDSAYTIRTGKTER